MQYLEEIILYMEIGSRFTKALLYKITWRKVYQMLFHDYILTEGITINGIDDFPLFNKSLKKIIFRVEYETSEKIQKIILIYGGLLSLHKCQNYKISIKNIIKENDIVPYTKPTIHNNEYEVIHYNYSFIVDHFLHMTNPIGIECNHLIVSQNYLLLHKTIYKNLRLFFEENDYKLINISFGPYVLSEYIKQYICNFILFDIGYYTCRICLIENNIMREFYILNVGTYHMNEVLKIKHKIKEENITALLENIDLTSNEEVPLTLQNFLINLFNKCFKFFKNNIVSSVDIPVFINGLDNFHPLEYFFNLKMNRECYKVSNYFQWKPKFEYLYAISDIYYNKSKKKHS